jgi:hypothetical protein
VRRFVSLAASTYLALLASPLGARAATPIEPSPSHAVSSGGLSDRLGHVSVVTGNRDWLVYQNVDRSAGRREMFTTSRLIARDRNGQTWELPSASQWGDAQVVGDIMTMRDARAHGTLVDVWNLADHTFVQREIPKHAWYLGAAPGGFFYSPNYGTGHVIQETMAGADTDLGALPHVKGEQEIANRSVASPKYALFDYGNQSLALYDLNGHRFEHLRVPKPYVGDLLRGCGSILGRRVICGWDTDTGFKHPQELINLKSGKTSLFSTPHDGWGSVLSVEGTTWVHHRHLVTRDTSGKLTTSSYKVTNHDYPIGAYNDVVSAKPGQRELGLATGASHPLKTIVVARRSVVTVAGFALSAHRIAWIDDSGKQGRHALHTAVVHGGRFRHESRIKAKPIGKTVGVSDDVLAYRTKHHGRSGLQIVAPEHSTFVPRMHFRTIAVSGTRVAYGLPDKSAAKIFVYNARTGATKTFGQSFASYRQTLLLALHGNRLVHNNLNGDLLVTNLVGGRTKTVASGCEEGLASIWRHLVAWQCLNSAGYLDLAGNSKARSLPRQIDSVNHLGVIVGMQHFDLVPFGAKRGTRFLAHADSPPVIAGSTVAWLNVENRLVIASTANIAQ